MTQDKADAIFSTELGLQLDMIFVTSDDHAFIRFSEAQNHALFCQDEDSDFDMTITEWYPSWDDGGEHTPIESQDGEDLFV